MVRSNTKEDSVLLINKKLQLHASLTQGNLENNVRNTNTNTKNKGKQLQKQIFDK